MPAVPAAPEAPLQPKPPGQGSNGFHIAWPSTSADLAMFSSSVASALAASSWALISMPLTDDECEAASLQAMELKANGTHRREVMVDYLGQGGRGRVAAFAKTPDSEELGDCDAELDGLFLALARVSWATMELNCHSRTHTSAWLPHLDVAAGEPLDQKDVESGLVAQHIDFIRRRHLCMMYFLAGEDARICLLPKSELRCAPIEVDVARKQILIFRHDLMSFRYEPVGASVVLQSWVLRPPDTLAIDQLDADRETWQQLNGNLVGPKLPIGTRHWITAMASRYPGSVHTPSSYWSMFVAGIDTAIRIPITRFDVDEYCSPDREARNKSYVYHGSFCADADLLCFDNRAFGITSTDLDDMQPIEGVILETGYQCLVAAGHTLKSLRGHECGVALGMTTRSLPGAAACGSRDKISNAAANSRLSHTFGLVGPMLNVDTACSSSLVAASAMADALRDRATGNRISEGLVLGVQTMFDPWCYILFSGPQMMSPRGRAFTFDTSADGFARGEGCGALFLHKCDSFKYTEGPTNPCFMGWCVNQDGRSASLTAPSGPSQQACMRASLYQTAMPYGDIVVAECHGTGTALGDTIEVNAVHHVLGQRVRCLFEASAKTHIGHHEAGAGMTGLMKLVTMLTSACGSPNCHLKQLNAHLKGDDYASVCETELVDTSWNSGLGGVSSFGFGGTNSHADVFAACHRGPRACGRVDLRKFDHVQVKCPITMGPIDHVSGEPVVPYANAREQYRADALRDEFAPYDISSHAYRGGFRFRSEAAQRRCKDDSPVMFSTSALFVCGSWSSWRKDFMESEGEGWFSAHAVLGETHCEYFYIGVGGTREEIYPAIDGAAEHIWIHGPDARREGRRWRIDVPADPRLRGVSIRLRTTTVRLTLSLKFEDPILASHIPSYNHAYAVVGSWTTWSPCMMQQGPGGQSWSTNFRIGASGQEEFYFTRDGDCRQAVYPSRPRATDSSARATGPDNLRQDKAWLVKGSLGEQVKLTLEVVDTKPVVTLVSQSAGDIRWEGLAGWARHQYSLSGTFNGWGFEPMEMYPQRPGVFVARGRLGETRDGSGIHGYVARFLVNVDGDADASYYPEVGLASSGESIVRGPGRSKDARHFLARSQHCAGATFEVTLDLATKDRRNIVTWTILR